MSMIETSRTNHILGCLYATLVFCFPLYILALFTSGALSLYTTSVGIVVTIIFSTTIPILTHRERARQALNSDTKHPHPLCRIPSIISAFLIVILWAAALGLTIVQIIPRRRFQNVQGLGQAEKVVTDIVVGVGIGQCVYVLAQILLFIAVGVMSALERRDVRRGKGSQV